MNFALLQDWVGPGGRIVGIDRSADMLAQARKKADRYGWDNVILIQADATALDPAKISAQITRGGGQALSEAALTTYALSLMQPWQDAWARIRMLTAEQARLGVLDMQRPTGASSVLTPLARIACWMGGADIDAHPWTALERDCTDVRAASVRGGHLQVRVGVKPSGATTSHN